MLEESELKNTAKDFSGLLHSNVQSKLLPVNKSIDDMLSRLEEFQTMISFARQERTNSTELLNTVLGCKPELYALFSKIDSLEKLIEHANENVEFLEAQIEKAEQELGFNENKSKVSNIFTPLFKKQSDKKVESSGSTNPQMFKANDYFPDT